MESNLRRETLMMLAGGVVLLTRLVGCEPDSIASGEARVTDSVDSGGPELPTLPACPGADFVPTFDGWYPANPRWYLRSSADLFGPWIQVNDAAGATGCPALATEGDVTTLSGDCTAETIQFAGTWRSEAHEDPNAYDFVLDAVSAKQPLGQWPQDVSASGTFYWDRTVADHQTVAFTDRAEGTYSLHGGDGLSGEFTFEAVESIQDTEQFVASGALVVDWDDGVGRYCPVVELHAAPGCPEEPDGYYAIQGAETWLMVANGSEECDGCVEVYTDGVWQETFCGVKPGLL